VTSIKTIDDDIYKIRIIKLINFEKQGPDILYCQARKISEILEITEILKLIT